MWTVIDTSIRIKVEKIMDFMSIKREKECVCDKEREVVSLLMLIRLQAPFYKLFVNQNLDLVGSKYSLWVVGSRITQCSGSRDISFKPRLDCLLSRTTAKNFTGKHFVSFCVLH